MLTLLRTENGKSYYIVNSKGVIVIECTQDELKHLMDDIEKSLARWDSE